MQFAALGFDPTSSLMIQVDATLMAAAHVCEAISHEAGIVPSQMPATNPRRNSASSGDWEERNEDALFSCSAPLRAPCLAVPVPLTVSEADQCLLPDAAGKTMKHSVCWGVFPLAKVLEEVFRVLSLRTLIQCVLHPSQSMLSLSDCIRHACF